MSAWLRVEHRPDGVPRVPERTVAEEAWFVERPVDSLSWGRRLPSSATDVDAAREWAAAAQSVASLCANEVTRVVGRGALSELILRAMAPICCPAADEDDAVAMVVETTGSPAGIAAALRLAGPGACILLAVRPLVPSVTVRTYHDLHRPGVEVIPVPWAGSVERQIAPGLVEWALDNLAFAPAGQPAPVGPWYRLGGNAVG